MLDRSVGENFYTASEDYTQLEQTTLEPLEVTTDSVSIEEMIAEMECNPLDNYRMMDICRTSDNPQFQLAAEELCDVLDLDGDHDLNICNAKLLLMEMTRLWKRRRKAYLGYFRNNSEWSFGSCEEVMGRYNPNGVSRRITRVIDALEKHGYIEHHKGFRFQHEDGQGYARCSRIRMKDKLLDGIIKPYGLLEAVTREHQNTAVIRLRGDNGRGRKTLIAYDTTLSHIVAMEGELRAYNKLLSQTDIGVSDQSILERVFIDDKFVYRRFSKGSFDLHGRFYGGWWINATEADRTKITINGQPTVELDYEANHVNFLYGEEGVRYDADRLGDPYTLSGMEGAIQRKVVKGAVLMAINNSNPTTAWRALTSKLRLKKATAQQGYVRFLKQYEEIIGLFCAKHPLIAGKLFQERSLSLMNKDSKICATVIKRLTERSIPVLTIHDSFIVAAEHKDLLRSEMELAYTLNNMQTSLPRIK